MERTEDDHDRQMLRTPSSNYNETRFEELVYERARSNRRGASAIGNVGPTHDCDFTADIAVVVCLIQPACQPRGLEQCEAGQHGDKPCAYAYTVIAQGTGSTLTSSSSSPPPITRGAGANVSIPTAPFVGDSDGSVLLPVGVPAGRSVDPNTPSSSPLLVGAIVSGGSVGATGVDVEGAAGAGDGEFALSPDPDDDADPAHKEAEESPQLTSKRPGIPFVSDGK